MQTISRTQSNRVNNNNWIRCTNLPQSVMAWPGLIRRLARVIKCLSLVGSAREPAMTMMEHAFRVPWRVEGKEQQMMVKRVHHLPS